MTVVIPSIHYLAVLPVLIFFGASLALLLVTSLVRAKVGNTVATVVTVVASLAVLVVNVFQWRCVDKMGASSTIAHAIVLDDFSVVASAVIALAVLMSALVAHDWAKRERLSGVEFHILALASSGGALLMTQANDLTRDIHDRMPVILSPDMWKPWMDPNTPAAELKGMLLPYEPDKMTYWAVSRRVGATR